MNDVKKIKSPLLAAVLSAFVFPGTGQLYCRQYKKAAAMILASAALMLLFIVPFVTGFAEYLYAAANVETIDIAKFAADIASITVTTSNGVLSSIVFIIWLYSTIDAYIAARKYNKGINADGTI